MSAWTSGVMRVVKCDHVGHWIASGLMMGQEMWDSCEDFTDDGLQCMWGHVRNWVLVNQGTPMKPVEMWESEWWSWHECEGLMRRIERRNMTQMKWHIVISPVNEEWVEHCIGNVEGTRNEQMKLEQPGDSQWPGGWFQWNCWWEQWNVTMLASELQLD